MSKFEVGHQFAPKSYLINRAALVTYADASGDHNPIHQDEAFAVSVGLPNVIAHGMYTMGLVGEYVGALARETAGTSARVREFSARFTKPVVVPANTDVELIVSASVVEMSGSELRLELSAVCDGVKVLGMAKALVVL